MPVAEAHAVWLGGMASRLEDGRGHSVAVDLPADEGGTDAGTSSLELSLLSLAGCIQTIFLLVARRRRVHIDALAVTVRAERGPGAPTYESVAGTLRIASPSSDEELSTTLRLTMRRCPVGVLFEQAHVPVTVRLERIHGPVEGGPPTPEHLVAPGERAGVLAARPAG